MKNLDIVFIIDCTLGLDNMLKTVSKTVSFFDSDLIHSEYNVNYGLIEFRDCFVGDKIIVHKFGANNFTTEIKQLESQISSLSAKGNNEKYISSVDALFEATKLKFREETNRIYILITDAPPYIPDKQTKSLPDLFTNLKDSKINQIYIVTHIQITDNKIYIELTNHLQKRGIESLIFDFGNNLDFQKLFKGIIKSIQSKSKETKEKESFAERLAHTKINIEQFKNEKIDANNPYTIVAGQSIIADAKKDIFGNAQGNQYDLAKDGAFKGLQIAILHLYTGEGFDFKFPTTALTEKGFKIVRWCDNPPPINEFKSVLKKSCQLWVISTNSQLLNNDYLTVIKDFFDSGKGLYLWGDNEPYYADANYISQNLFESTMNGNVWGDQVVSIQKLKNNVGFIENHPITTGLEFLYEGVTIATINPNTHLKPLVYGTANNLVTAVYDKNGKRAILDGGFTRLFIKWDTAGSGRYVKNAASWLTNYEKFGNKIFS